ncbi:MAG: hypothetical protein HXX08_09915 [Chloroflexi bacterium]|uniref:Uncharacterized protein n=1 Tax=Candidatus Chlorohelix allophototropha TaxID=3003348 RepID=A0A8T7LYR9_9CHLR|nr:hypothetical protein [Chloroflexota bacterium]WJW65560.1 hypothetical protein OZ401_001327 [Chloroflexota bacterium L227-S17]
MKNKISGICIVLLALGALLTACGNNTATVVPATDIPTTSISTTVPTVTTAAITTTSTATPTTTVATKRPIINTGNQPYLGGTPEATIAISEMNELTTAYGSEVVLTAQEATYLYRKLRQAASNFDSVRVEATYLTEGKVNGDYYKAVVITSPPEAFYEEHKTGSTTSRTVLVDGVVYRDEYGKGWVTEITNSWVDTVWDNLSYDLPDYQVSEVENMGNIGVKRMPDEQLDGIKVGVVLVDRTTTTYKPLKLARLYFDKANMRPVKMVREFIKDSGNSATEWRAYDYNSTTLKVEAPMGVNTSSPEAIALYNKLLYTTGKFSSISFKLIGKQSDNDINFKAVVLVLPSGNPEAYSAEMIQEGKITRGVALDKVYYDYNEANGWRIISSLDAEGWGMGVTMFANPMSLAQSSSPTLKILPDEQLNERTVGVLSYEAPLPNNGDTSTTITQKAVIRYDKTSMLPLKVRIDYSDGKSYLDWEALEYNNPSLKIEAPAEVKK